MNSGETYYLRLLVIKYLLRFINWICSFNKVNFKSKVKLNEYYLIRKLGCEIVLINFSEIDY